MPRQLCAPPALCPATSVPHQLCAPPPLCPATSVPRRLYASPHVCPASSPPGLPSLTLPHLSRPIGGPKKSWHTGGGGAGNSGQWRPKTGGKGNGGKVVGPGPGIEAQRRQGPKVAGSRRVRAGQWVVAVVVAKPKALKPGSGALITGASLVGETRTRRSARPGQRTRAQSNAERRATAIQPAFLRVRVHVSGGSDLGI